MFDHLASCRSQRCRWWKEKLCTSNLDKISEIYTWCSMAWHLNVPIYESASFRCLLGDIERFPLNPVFITNMFFSFSGGQTIPIRWGTRRRQTLRRSSWRSWFSFLFPLVVLFPRGATRRNQLTLLPMLCHTWTTTITPVIILSRDRAQRQSAA